MPRPPVINRGRTLRMLLLAAGTLVTLAGLFAMHGLPMSMSMPTTMPNSMANSMSGPMAGMHAGAMPTTASPAQIVGVQVGCDAQHDGCLAVLRGQPQHAGPAATVAVLPLTDAPALRSAEGTVVEPRGSPPSSRPSLTELCISRT